MAKPAPERKFLPDSWTIGFKERISGAMAPEEDLQAPRLAISRDGTKLCRRQYRAWIQ